MSAALKSIVTVKSITKSVRSGIKPFRLSRVILLASLCSLGTAWGAAPEAVYADKGMVASREIRASKVGAEILSQGGNAVDAAVATAFALAVTHPSAGNLGGGGFAVVSAPGEGVITLDFREKAPAKAHRDMYLDEKGEVVKGLSTQTHLAAGVPGSVAGLLALHEKYGALSRKQVIQPAQRLARKGVRITYGMARQFLEYRERSFSKSPASMAKFSRKDGTALQEGDLWRQPLLAATLKRIVREGRDGFYKGETAQLIVAEMARGKGLITAADLETYEPVWRKPVHGTYRGYEIYSMPPPSSGGAMVIQMLNMLEVVDVGRMGWGSASLAHLMIEVERRAYADRAEHFGDPDFYEVPLAQMLDKDYARQRFASISRTRASNSNAIHYGLALPEESMETTHLSAMDVNGWAVALTTTLNLSFGSGISVEGAGFLLNNEMDDFSSKPGVPNAFGLLGAEANAIAPHKRMLSSMTPTLVMKDGVPLLATGSPGGSTIITTVFQVLINVLDHGMPLGEAVAAPRFHHQWKPSVIKIEPRSLSPDTLDRLEDMGHREFSRRGLPGYSRLLGSANSVMWSEVDGKKRFQGAHDPRRNGGGAVGL